MLIFISQRLRTVQKADRILVLADGKLAEDGTHEQLMRKQSRLYKKLFILQAKSHQ